MADWGANAMSPTLALIPAKRHSEGVPDKNWKDLLGDEGASCARLALMVGVACCDRTYLTIDEPWPDYWFGDSLLDSGWLVLYRPHGLPDTMLDVVRDALAQVPGPDDEIIVLLQPTSPLRTAETVRQAIRMLEADKSATSVVSVSPSYPIEWTLSLHSYGELYLQYHDFGLLGLMPSRRQDCEPAYKRDGVVYAFRRTTMREYLDIYGSAAMALHTPPAESLSIDTPADWDEAVRRLNQQ